MICAVGTSRLITRATPEFYAAARKSQLIVSTQSADLLSCFEPHQLIVVERQGNESKFKRLDKAALQVWLDDEYSLGDLWRKNILGGRP